jgi:small-conductance mechanosensitive channel
MRPLARSFLAPALLVFVFLIWCQASAQQQSSDNKTSEAARESIPATPQLGQIIPLATELSGRFAVLENKLKAGLDVSQLETKYAGIEKELKGNVDRLKGMKDSETKYVGLADLKETVQKEGELLKEINEPLRSEIDHLGVLRKEWLAEEKRWDEWQASLMEEEAALEQLKTTFAMAHFAIDKALNLVLLELREMLAVQEKAGNLQVRITALAAELDGLIAVKRRSVLLEVSPPMFSAQYFSQFGSLLWYSVQTGLHEISWPGDRFFAQKGWIILVQFFLSFAVIISVHRNRQVLKDLNSWRFLVARPFSAGFFLGSALGILLYSHWGAPSTIEAINAIIGGICFARLSGVLIKASWQRQYFYGAILVYVFSILTYMLNLPRPLLRLYVVLTSAIVVFFCLRWAGESRRQKDRPLHTWTLSLTAFLCTAVVVAELLGKSALGGYLFAAGIFTTALALVFRLFIYMVRGVLEWIFYGSPFRRKMFLSGDTDPIFHRMARFAEAGIWGLLFAPAILAIWGFYENMDDARRGLLSFGFNLGSQRLTLGLMITTAAVIYGSFLMSRILQKVLRDKVFVKRQVERGVQHSILRLIHYVVLFMGFLLALSILGFGITKLTIMLSALGVGIGFGLQSIVNNFVSGIILLFERPLRVGDYIEFGGKWAEIRSIGLRATTVQTFDHADVIIPNADLITNQVTNWTLTNRKVRIIIPVGVAYGSDVPLVVETLMACAKANSKAAEWPPPQVLFLSFGESSLDFDLRVWALDADIMQILRSELHQEIERRFREAGIEIAFPQRDLHLRSVEESVILRTSAKDQSWDSVQGVP